MRVRMLALPLVALLVCAAPAAAAAAPSLGDPLVLSTTGALDDYNTDAEAPVLSYDPVSHRVLAVWSIRAPALGDSTAVAARVLDADGQPVGPQLLLPGLEYSGSQVAVASRGPRSGWVVAAVANTAAPRGMELVAVSVSRAAAVGTPHVLSRRALFPHTFVSAPALAFDRRTGRGVVAWARDTTGARDSVLARPIDADGRSAGRIRRVAGAPFRHRSISDVALIHEAGSRRWLAAWQEQWLSNAPGHRLHRSFRTRRLTAAGRRAGREHRVGRVPAGVVGAPVLAPAAGGAAFLLTTYDNGERPRRVRLFRLDRRGRPHGRRARIVSVQPGSSVAGSAGPLIARGPGRRQSLLVYFQGCNRVGHVPCPTYAPVLGQRLDARGRRTGPADTIAAGSMGFDALARTGRDRYLVAWQGVVSTGEPYDDPNAMFVVTPRKGEIFARTVSFP